MLTHSDLFERYNQIKSKVEVNQMVSDGTNKIQNWQNENELISIVRDAAKNWRILFGSVESAIYHVKIHPVNPLSQYINLANQLIANDDSVASITYKGDSIDIEFNVKSSATCVINIKRIDNIKQLY